MTHSTRRSSGSLTDSVNDPKVIALARVTGTSTLPAQLSDDDIRPPERDKNRMFVVEQIAKLLEKNCSRIAVVIRGQARRSDLIQETMT